MYPYLRNNLNIGESTTQFCIGVSAGSMSGVLTNSISAIKYHMWGQDNRSGLSSVNEMWSSGGFRPFFKGTYSTMMRDIVFGGTYEVLRYRIHASLKQSQDKVSPINNSSLE